MDSASYETVSQLTNEHVEVALYATEKPNNVKAKILWCDELKDKWYKKEIIEEFHKKDKIMYAMSKELLEPCSKDEIKTEWERLLKLKFDGICTDHPKELSEFQHSESEFS